MKVVIEILLDEQQWKPDDLNRLVEDMAFATNGSMASRTWYRERSQPDFEVTAAIVE